MNDKLFVIDGVQELTKTEAQKIDGGMLFGFWSNMLKLGLGLGIGWGVSECVRSC